MINKVILVGNVGKDPEVRHLENGTAVASFSLATSETYKDRDGNRQTRTEWHNIVLWRGLADVVEKYVKKGQMLYIEGRLTSRVITSYSIHYTKLYEILCHSVLVWRLPSLSL